MTGLTRCRVRMCARLLSIAGILIAGGLALTIHADEVEGFNETDSQIRRIKVPVQRLDAWLKGDWQPLPLSEIERHFDDAGRLIVRPTPQIEQAEYSATFADGEIRSGQFSWSVHRSANSPAVLALGSLNLNLQNLAWTHRNQPATKQPVICGISPQGHPLLLVESPEGTVTGTWSASGRQLAASTEFDLQLPRANRSILNLQVPRGIVVTSSVGEVQPLSQAALAETSPWQVRLGGRTRTRLRFTMAPDPAAARPRNVVRSNINYVVRADAVRILADFEFDVLESSVNELVFSLTPEVQVTSVEYGDGVPMLWTQHTVDQEPVVTVKFPEPISGPGTKFQLRAISQVKQFGPRELPRIQPLQAVVADCKVVLGLQSPFTAADVRADGYRQLSLTTGGDGETLQFRQYQPGATITVVPAENRSDLTCRAVSLLQCDSNQTNLTTQLECSAFAGSVYSLSFRIPAEWEVFDVRSVDSSSDRELTGHEIREAPQNGPMLRVDFRNSINSSHPQRFRILARRRPSKTGDQLTLPLFAPAGATSVEHLAVVSADHEWRPTLVDPTSAESVSLESLPVEYRSLDFLANRLADPLGSPVVFRSFGAADAVDLRLDPVSANSSADKSDDDPPQAAGPVKSVVQLDRDPKRVQETGPVAIETTLRISDAVAGFDEYRARIHTTTWDDNHPLRFRLPPPAELMAVSVAGKSLSIASEQGHFVVPKPSREPGTAGGAMTIEIDYRVPAELRALPDRRAVLIPTPMAPVLKFDLSILVSPHLTIEAAGGWMPPESQSEAREGWQRLLGPFASRQNDRWFNPLDLSKWRQSLRTAGRSLQSSTDLTVQRTQFASLPADLQIVVWQNSSVTGTTIAAWALCGWLCLICRMHPFRGTRVIGAIVLAGLCAATHLAPLVYSQITAGGLVGFVVAALLPNAILKWRQAPAVVLAQNSVGSTRTYMSASLLLIASLSTVLTIWCGRLADAQDNPSGLPARPDARGAATRRTFDVIIPVHENGAPPETPELVYAQQELLDFLQQRASQQSPPPYLIGACHYAGQLDGSRQISVKASFDVHVFATEPIVHVTLPVGNANLGGNDACLVNGQAFPLLNSRNGRGVLIGLPGLAPEPAAPLPPQSENAGANASEPAVPLAFASPIRQQTFHIELKLEPPTEVSSEGLSAAVVSIPETFRTQASFSSSVPELVIGLAAGDVNRKNGPAVWPQTSRQSLTPAPCRQLVYRWGSRAELEAPPVTEAQVEQSCLADFLPGALQLRYHLGYRSKTGRLDAVRWDLPPGHVLQSIQAPHVSGYRFRPLANGHRELLIEFSKPQADEFSITATFVVDFDPQKSPFQLQFMNAGRTTGADRLRIENRLNQVAIRHASDWLITLSEESATLATVKPKSVDQFLKEWNPTGARPQLAFELDQVDQLSVSVAAKQFSPTVRGTSIGRVSAHRLDWTYDAEVEQPAVSRFIYRLQVDPQLRVRNVTVKEAGADRLLRWSRVRDTLVLFLNDRATRTQAIRVEASLPISGTREFVLPRIQFLGAVAGPERLEVFGSQDTLVHFTNPDDFPLTATPTERPTNTAERLVLSLDVLPQHVMPRLIVERMPSKVFAEMTTILKRDQQSWQATTAIAFRILSGQVSEFSIDMPEDVATGMEITTQPKAQITRLNEADGRVQFQMHTAESIQTRMVAILAHPGHHIHQPWKLPDIRTGQVVVGSSQIIVCGDGIEPFEPTLQPDATAKVPDWLESTDLPEIPQNSRIYSWRGTQPFLEFREPRKKRQTQIDTAQLDVWCDADGTLRGWLGLALADSDESRVELTWPAGCRLSSLYAAGRFLDHTAAAAHDSSQLQVQLPADPTEPVVWLSWVFPSQSAPALTRPLALPIPWPRDLPVQHLAVNVHSAGEYRLETHAAAVSAAGTHHEPVSPTLLVTNDERRDTDSLVGQRADVDLGGTGMTPHLDSLVQIRNNRTWRGLFAVLWAGTGGLLAWFSAKLRRWLTARELIAWLVLAVSTWLTCSPVWGLGFLGIACARLLASRGTGSVSPDPASAAASAN
ncbi:MAG: hypothetical protein JSS02_30035 [Planctomycetes bacterium]|nr:hypothetical protein [Planctomycetota bacterium]